MGKETRSRSPGGCSMQPNSERSDVHVFLHAGATDLSACGEDDIRANSGHTQLSMTSVYDKAK